MNRRRIAFVVVTIVLGCTISGAIQPENPSSTDHGAAILKASLFSYQHPPRPSVSEWVQADTVEAGRVFIVQLPDSLSGLAIESYSSDRLPLKSWLLEKSFFWATTTEDRGVHTFDFQARSQLRENESEAMPSEEAIGWALTVVVQ